MGVDRHEWLLIIPCPEPLDIEIVLDPTSIQRFFLDLGYHDGDERDSYTDMDRIAVCSISSEYDVSKKKS